MICLKIKFINIAPQQCIAGVFCALMAPLGLFFSRRKNFAGFFICGYVYKIELISRFLRLFFITGKRV